MTWDKRVALRIIPILLFIVEIRGLLQAIRCQSSPDFSLFRYGSLDKYNSLDWASDSRILYWFTSNVFFTSSDSDACAAAGMSRSAEAGAPFGSFSLLWPAFLSICLSHFIETISCSLQHQPVLTDVGMSIFEHSLAFAEAETMILHVLGVGLFGSYKSIGGKAPKNETLIPASATARAISDATTSLTGPHLLDRLNVPVEVLLIALLSCCNAVTAHIIAIFNRQRSLRLINTGFWGLCFMGAFVWGFFNNSSLVTNADGHVPEDLRFVSGLLHFPTVCIVGFVPHLTILFGILICTYIYILALILTALSLGTNPNIPQATTLWERFSIAHENLQAAIQMRNVQIKWHEDFYTALLRIGFVALTAASEAVFLNEGRSVEVRQFTWLEEERLDEIVASRPRGPAVGPGSHFQISEKYGIPSAAPETSGGAEGWESGYAKERKLERDKETGALGEDSVMLYPNPRPGGVGALQRTTRFYLIFIYMRGIYFLIAGWIAYGLGVLLDRLGIMSRPRWLRSIVGKSLKRAAMKKSSKGKDGQMPDSLDFWLLTDEGELTTPRTSEVDIEPEMRRRLMMEHHDGEADKILDERLYSWWKVGGWWGSADSSGEYRPPDDAEDTTSVVSMSLATSERGEEEFDEWESDSDGRRTPTQQSPLPSVSTSRESTPASFADTPLDPQTLARLLNPPDRASKDEARILASHLAATSSDSSDRYPHGRIMTRSRYRQELERERSRVLLSGRRARAPPPTVNLFPVAPSADGARGALTPAEESEVLEQLIISRREAGTSTQRPRSALEENDETPASGPMCVVCQSSARTIIAWPCRCLCVCEDCRVSLALNNFSNCVTCRRQVAGFVRLWVP